MTIVSTSPQQTQKFAADLTKKILGAQHKTGAAVIALEGELGAGKTVFTKGLARALGVKEKITSPTFVIMKQYELGIRNYEFLYHIDTYRLKDHRELIPLGIKEILADPKNIVVIEWSERVRKILPKQYTQIHLDHIAEEQRKIVVIHKA